MKQPSSLRHPAYAKLELLRNGLKLTSPAHRAPFLDIVFPKGVWASLGEADFNLPQAEYALVQEQEFSYLVKGSHRVHVEVRSNPDFYTAETSSGKHFGRIARIRANYVQVRDFEMLEREHISANDVLEVVRTALGRGWAEYVSFVDVSPEGDKAIYRLLPFVEAVKKHLDTHISIQTRAPVEQVTIDQAYASGVDAVCFQADQAWQMLSYAARIFLPGSVVTTLTLDRDKAALRIDIGQLIARGIFPVLVYRTSSGTRSAERLSITEAISLFRTVAVELRKCRFKMGWVPHAEAVLQSLDPGYFERRTTGKLVRGIMRTVVGSKLVFSVSSVRRKLRVHEK